MGPDVDVIIVSERGQIVLPKKTRDRLNFRKGDKLVMIEKSGRIVLQKASEAVKSGLSQGLQTFVASQKSLKKDWDYKGDEVWDEL